jgi:hypothetical protein
MRIKLRLLSAGLLLLIFFTVCVKYAYSEIKKSTYNEIRVSYINGYYEALHLKIEIIKQLQANENLLKQAVLNAADRYIAEVEGMNK